MDKQTWDIAVSYIGTPHINGGNVKGAGLDCCTLPAHLYKDFFGAEADISFGYSADWYCKRDCQELLLPYLEKYCNRVEELQPKDIISYSWGRAKYAHLAVYLGDNMVIHCSANHGTEIVEMDAPYFFDIKGKSRITGYWRLK